jgi:hypothetical protein
VKEAVAEWERRSDAKQKRKDARTKALKTKARKYKRIEGAGPRPPKPRTASFYYAEAIPARGRFNRLRTPAKITEAWLPAELSPDLDPDDSPPLPVPEDREVSLAERYAVLAAVWNARWNGDEKIDPWRRWRQSRPCVITKEEYKEYKREGMPGLAYALLVSLVGLTTDDAPTDRLSEKDALIVQTWLAKVQTDLTKDGANPVECLVTLQQAAAMVSRSKKTLERRKGNMPMPKVSGGGGKPDEWEWAELRPWLEKEFKRKLPERFPADRLRTS